MALLIVVDTIMFILSTEPAFQDRISIVFEFEVTLMSVIFLVEYSLRLYVVTESRKYRDPFWGRIRFVGSMSALIDAAAFMPFFLRFLFWHPIPTLSYLRVLRLLRILKTERYAEACASAWRVIRFNGEILIVAVMMCLFLLLFTSTALYYLQPGLKHDTEDFQSIPACMYLALLMLTGQGVPEGQLPWYTKFIVIMTTCFSVAMFAIPSSMLTWGFEAEAIRMARSKYIKDKKKEKHFQLHNEEMPESDSSSTSSEGGGNSSDEEYFRQIAGIVVEQEIAEEAIPIPQFWGDEEEEEEKEIENEAKEIFNEIDSNHSDNVSFKEFLDFWKRHCAQGMLTSGSPRNDNISGPFPNALHMHNFPPPSPPPQPLDVIIISISKDIRALLHHHMLTIIESLIRCRAETAGWLDKQGNQGKTRTFAVADNVPPPHPLLP
eukprot:jgi/Bigna1/74220/fgenesh1_pg.28_\